MTCPRCLQQHPLDLRTFYCAGCGDEFCAADVSLTEEGFAHPSENGWCGPMSLVPIARVVRA